MLLCIFCILFKNERNSYMNFMKINLIYFVILNSKHNLNNNLVI